MLNEKPEAVKKFMDTQNPMSKREVLGQLSSKLELLDKMLLFQPDAPFVEIEAGILETRAIFGRLEPLENGLDKLKKEEQEALSTIWSG